MDSGDEMRPTLSILTELAALFAIGALATGGVLWWWPLLVGAIVIIWTPLVKLALLWRIVTTSVCIVFLAPIIALTITGQLLIFPPGCSHQAIVAQLREIIPRSTGYIDIGPMLAFSAIRTVGQNPTTCRADVDFTNTGNLSGLLGVQPVTYQITETDTGEYYVELWFE